MKKSFLFIATGICISSLLLALLPVKRIGLHSMHIKSLPLVVLNNLTNHPGWKVTVKDRVWEKTGMLNDTNNLLRYKCADNNVESRGSFAVSIAVDGNSILTIRDTAVFTGIVEKIHFLVNPSKYNRLINDRLIELKKQLELALKTSAGVYFWPEFRAAQKIITLSERKQMPVTSDYIEARYLKLYQKVNTMQNHDIDKVIYKNTPADSGLAIIDVGLSLPVNTLTLPKNVTIHALPSSNYVTARFKGNYSDLPFKLEVIKDWMMKKQVYTAADWWIEQPVRFDGSKIVFVDSLYIIQPVFEIPAQF